MSTGSKSGRITPLLGLAFDLGNHAGLALGDFGADGAHKVTRRDAAFGVTTHFLERDGALGSGDFLDFDVADFFRISDMVCFLFWGRARGMAMRAIVDALAFRRTAGCCKSPTLAASSALRHCQSQPAHAAGPLQCWTPHWPHTGPHQRSGRRCHARGLAHPAARP